MQSMLFVLLAGIGMLACAMPPSHPASPSGEVSPSSGISMPDDASQSTVRDQSGKDVIGQSDFMIQPQHFDMGEVLEGEEARARLFVRNTGVLPLHIVDVQSACGCTVSSLGSKEVPPGGFTTLDVSIDTTAKGDSITKKVTLLDALGRRAEATLSLRVKENPHAGDMSGRGIFSGKCAACHVEPAKGKRQGREIYAAACAMCHGSQGQGAYAPRLRGMDADALSSILEHGINRRMPAFAQAKGGPLTSNQIRELSIWLSGLDE